MINNIIKIAILFIIIFLIYFLDKKIFWVFGGFSIADIAILFSVSFTLLISILIMIFYKSFEETLLKKIFFSTNFIIFFFILLISLVFIKYFHISCDDLSEEQKCVCLDIQNFQLNNDNTEVYDQFVDKCSKFRDLNLNAN